MKRGGAIYTGIKSNIIGIVTANGNALPDVNSVVCVIINTVGTSLSDYVGLLNGYRTEIIVFDDDSIGD